MKFKYTLLTVVLTAAAAASSQAALVISQYYEGPSTSKFIEITNTGTTEIDLSTYKLGLWTNAAAEGYKNDAAPTQSLTFTGTLAAGATILYGNSGNASPSYAVSATTATNNNVINFNGNDSIAIWTGTTFATANVVDAIGFTNAGNEGIDRSFVRISDAAGWNTTTGSNATTFTSVWTQYTNADVNNALSTSNEYLGFAAIPEPAAALLGAIGFLGILRRRR